MIKGEFRVGDRVQVQGDAESCCAAEDAGLFGEIIKIKNSKHFIVKTTAGEWGHCPECITLFVASNHERRDSSQDY